MFLGYLSPLFNYVYHSINPQSTTERKVVISHFHTIKNGKLQHIDQKISDLIDYNGKEYKFKDLEVKNLCLKIFSISKKMI